MLLLNRHFTQPLRYLYPPPAPALDLLLYIHYVLNVICCVYYIYYLHLHHHLDNTPLKHTGNYDEGFGRERQTKLYARELQQQNAG